MNVSTTPVIKIYDSIAILFQVLKKAIVAKEAIIYMLDNCFIGIKVF